MILAIGLSAFFSHSLETVRAAPIEVASIEVWHGGTSSW